MHSTDLECYFCISEKNKRNSAAAAWNIHAAFGNGTVSEQAPRRGYAEFETGYECLKKVLQDKTLLLAMKFYEQ